LIDSVLAAGTKSGYTFTMTATAGAAGASPTYSSLAKPTSLGLTGTGTRAFCSDQTMVIYGLAGQACTPATGAPIQ
jgi:hypothetical protein